jgi:ionotropic kainate glutamate receptor 2
MQSFTGIELQCPRLHSYRVVYMTTYLTSVVMLASYSATLTSFLTVRTVKLPFDNLEEFLKAGTHKLGTLEHSTVLNFFRVSSVAPYMHLLNNKNQFTHKITD